MRAAVISKNRAGSKRNKKMTTVARMDQSEFWATIRKSQLTQTYVDFAAQVLHEADRMKQNVATAVQASAAPSRGKRSLMRRMTARSSRLASVSSARALKNDELIATLDQKATMDHMKLGNKLCCPCCERLPVINPQNSLKIMWDFYVAVLIFYSVLMIPYAISFGAEASAPQVVLDWIVDTCFAIDMVLNFFTGFRIGSEKYVVAKGSIALRYLKGWFTIDLFSTIPIDTIVGAFINLDSSSTRSAADIKTQLRTFKLIRGLRLLRLLKLARLFKLKKLAAILDDSDFFHPAMITVFSLLFKIVFVAHMLSCFWYLVGSPESNEDQRDGWVTAFGIQDEPNVVKYR